MSIDHEELARMFRCAWDAVYMGHGPSPTGVHVSLHSVCIYSRHADMMKLSVHLTVLTLWSLVMLAMRQPPCVAHPSGDHANERKLAVVFESLHTMASNATALL